MDEPAVKLYSIFIRSQVAFALIALVLTCSAIEGYPQSNEITDPRKSCGSSLTREIPFVIDPQSSKHVSNAAPEDVDFSVLAVPIATKDGESTLGTLKITLASVSSGSTFTLDALSSQWTFGRRVIPGRYLLKVNGSPPYSCAPSRIIEINKAQSSIRVHLGPPSVWHFRLQRSLLPAKFHEDRIAMYFNGPVPTGKEMEAALNDISSATTSDDKQTVLKVLASPISYAPSGKESPFPILEFSLPNNTDNTSRADISNRLQKAFANRAQVGTIVETYHSGLRFSDGRFTVRKSTSITIEEFRTKLEAQSARLLRQLDLEGGRWLVGFSKNYLSANISLIESLIDSSILEYGEPELVVSLKTQHLPAEWPNDDGYGVRQFKAGDPLRGNHRRQKIRDAWTLLSDLDSSSLTIGSSKIYVATLDRGISLPDSEIDCPSADGSPQISVCFDAGNGINCQPSGHELDIDSFGKPIRHGIAVFGIIGACANNGVFGGPNTGNIAGMAPGVHHIVVKKPEPVGGTRYADTLLWLAGLDISCPLEPDPAELGEHPCHWPKLSSPASVINCSHQMDDSSGELSEQLSSAIDRLLSDGRGGKGILLVYSAGNDAKPVEQTHTLAADGRTIAVSNCEASAGSAVEHLHHDSNYGEAIEICALGEGAPTISKACGPNASLCDAGQTSAAAPQVTATIALMLSANPELNFKRIRTILRESASTENLDDTSDNKCRFNSGRSLCYGSGRLNSCRAVAAALRDRGIPAPEDKCNSQ